MSLSCYMNAPTESTFLALRHGMEYLMHQPHEPIMYPTKENFKINERPHQCFFNAGSA